MIMKFVTAGLLTPRQMYLANVNINVKIDNY